MGMTPEEYDFAIATLGLTQVKAAELFDVNDRTSRRWIRGEVAIPDHIESMLRIMVHGKIDPMNAVDIARDKNPVRGILRLMGRFEIALSDALRWAETEVK